MIWNILDFKTAVKEKKAPPLLLTQNYSNTESPFPLMLSNFPLLCMHQLGVLQFNADTIWSWCIAHITALFHSAVPVSDTRCLEVLGFYLYFHLTSCKLVSSWPLIQLL